MKLYLIGGLGADERVFNYLNVTAETQVIRWIDPLPAEDLSSYVYRLIDQIDQSEEFALLGVSFGGIVAVELAKILSPKLVILISSVAVSDQLPQIYLALGKTGILNWIPDSILKPPSVFLGFMFGAKNRQLLRQIISDTQPSFIRWALDLMIGWSHQDTTANTVRIHGTRDRLIPLKGQAKKVVGGGHFMIVDRARTISKMVNAEMAERNM